MTNWKAHGYAIHVFAMTIGYVAGTLGLLAGIAYILGLLEQAAPGLPHALGVLVLIGVIYLCAYMCFKETLEENDKGDYRAD